MKPIVLASINSKYIFNKFNVIELIQIDGMIKQYMLNGFYHIPNAFCNNQAQNR